MGNVLGMAKQQQIQALVALGWSDRAIGSEVEVDRGTVAKYRRTLVEVPADSGGAVQNQPEVPTDPGGVPGQNQPEVPADPRVAAEQNQPEAPTDLGPLPSTNSHQLRPHVERVRAKFLQKLTAQRIYQDLVEEHGFTGSYDSVKRYVKKLRKKQFGYAERLPHLPGREAQVDFGKSTCKVNANGKYRRVWVFKMTLSCSKHAYEELVLQQDMETFIRCHEHAFAAFGGVPEIITLDNLKAAVLRACLYDPLLNQTYLAFATYWGFAANPCAPRRPDHKGVVERDVGYTKHNALEGRTFESIEQGNEFLRHWNKRWARTRIHGTTKCQVWKLFCELEQPRLRPLAPASFACFQPGSRKVDVNGLIEVEARFYPVPHTYLGEYVTVHFNSDYVKVLDDKQQLIIEHRRLSERGRVAPLPVDMLPPWKHPTLESQERYYCRKASSVGPAFHELVYRVLASSDPLAIRRTRGLLHLAVQFGSRVTEQAALRANALGPCRYPAFRQLCEQITEQQARLVEAGQLTQDHELMRSLNEYDTVVTQRSL